MTVPVTRRKRCTRCGELCAASELANIEQTLDVTDDPFWTGKRAGITTHNGRRYVRAIIEAHVCEGCAVGAPCLRHRDARRQGRWASDAGRRRQGGTRHSAA